MNMKIISALLVVFNMIGGLAIAQSESSFGAFLASPVGDFKSSSLDKGGFAKSGAGIVFDSKYKPKFLSAKWSIISHSTYQWNDMDTQEVSRKFTEALGNRTEVSDSKYSPILTTIGPGYDFTLTDKLSLGVKGGVGLMFNNTKAFTVRVFDGNNNLIADQLVNFDDKVAFAYSLGVELKFDIVKDLLAFSLYSDYTSAKQSTELSFTSAAPVNSFQKLEYLNTGFKLVFAKRAE